MTASSERSNTAETATHAAPSGVAWLERWKASSLAVLFGFIGGLAANSIDLVNDAIHLLDRLHVTTSESLALAQDSAESRLSDNLASLSWRRLFLAKVYAQRAADGASFDQMESAWERYVEADASWNASLMTNIVGLQKFYGTIKSSQFEYDIASRFSSLDDCLRQLRLSGYMKSLQNSNVSIPEDIINERNDIATAVKHMVEEDYYMMYVFVRCFPKPAEKPSPNDIARIPYSCEKLPAAAVKCPSKTEDKILGQIRLYEGRRRYLT